MKNIYNLLTDAFVRIGKNEADYHVIVEDQYKVTITSRLVPPVNYAKLTLIMGTDGELYDFRDENTLFTNDEWDEFCIIIDRQIPSSFITAGQLLQINTLLYQTNNDMMYDDSAVQDTEDIEIGDSILANYRNLTVDTNVARFVDLDDFTDEPPIANIYQLD
jgi:hypothetical protein